MKRQAASRKMVIALLLLGLAALMLCLAGLRRPISTSWFGDRVLFGFFGMFIFPMVLLGFGTGALGDDRDEKTLVYLLTRPLARWAIYAGKLLGIAPPALALAIGGLWALCALGGLSDRSSPESAFEDLFRAIAPAYLWGALAYLSVFHFLAAIFRHSTLVAIAYVFFVEVFIGEVPGILKRLSIRFFTESMAYEAAQSLGLGPPSRVLFQPVSAGVARMVLIGITFGFLALGALAFSRREYSEPE